MRPYGIHWFRRDLRLEGNRALEWNARRHDGRVLGLFVFDRRFLGREDFAPNRFAFFTRTLEALRRDLRERGGDLLCLDGGPDAAFERLFSLASPAAVSFSRDYEPYALDRDARLSAWLERRTIVQTERDHLLVEPGELHKPDGTYYQVFTPFKKRWLKIVGEEGGGGGDGMRERWTRPWRAPKLAATWKSLNPGLAREEVLAEFVAPATVPLPEAGHAAALKQLRAFGKKLAAYPKARDYPAVAGTSQLSIYFKNGSLTVPEAIRGLDLLEGAPGQYLVELVWREFYYHLLAHTPRVETEAFDRKYIDIEWPGRDEWFRAWCEGRTGYPIVDAGMRQLNETGWMHNRVRMIVASFLVKDLHVDWRRGERYFMQKLLDGDLAPNNGGWQWAASTGADPVPYFRVFNPTLQGRRFDPQGEYVRRWVPELADLGAREIHEPRDPIVDHATQKAAFVRLFKSARSKAGG